MVRAGGAIAFLRLDRHPIILLSHGHHTIPSPLAHSMSSLRKYVYLPPFLIGLGASLHIRPCANQLGAREEGPQALPWRLTLPEEVTAGQYKESTLSVRYTGRQWAEALVAITPQHAAVLDLSTPVCGLSASQIWRRAWAA